MKGNIGLTWKKKNFKKQFISKIKNFLSCIHVTLIQRQPLIRPSKKIHVVNCM